MIDWKGKEAEDAGGSRKDSNRTQNFATNIFGACVLPFDTNLQSKRVPDTL